MLRSTCAKFATLVLVFVISSTICAQEPVTLLGRIADWQYPDSIINVATMSDAATLSERGERTVPSMQCKTVMTTTDPIEKVFKYYKSKLEPETNRQDSQPEDKPATDAGRSVTFHSDSENRPLTIHMIFVNTDKTSTTLVISRDKSESETHIAWAQYEKL